MNNRITRREVVKQFTIAIELQLEWIERGEDSNEKRNIDSLEEDHHEPRLITATEVAKILNISKGAAYQLIQERKIPCVRINRSVRVRQEDLITLSPS